MKTITTTLLLATSFVITGCAGSPAWYLKHQDKQIQEIDGYRIATVPMGENRYDAFADSVKGEFDVMTMKQYSIEAIEKRSGCKVIDSGFIPPRAIGIGWILQTKTDCTK